MRICHLLEQPDGVILIRAMNLNSNQSVADWQRKVSIGFLSSRSNDKRGVDYESANIIQHKRLTCLW